MKRKGGKSGGNGGAGREAPEAGEAREPENGGAENGEPENGETEATEASSEGPAGPLRYAIGIDLGTTHCALARVPFVDEKADPPHPEPVGIAQLVAQGTVEERTLLPSFLYFPHESEGAQALPWDPERRYVVGEHARARGVDAPARLVASAKSWLGHAGVDRRAALLPQGAAEDVAKVSPVEASRRYLEHLGEAWAAWLKGRGEEAGSLAEQEIVLTVPASFDASARDLTVEAARAAGFGAVTLLEEPQAALYAWIDARGERWRKEIKVGDVILVVDVGGGTTDFSAIAVLEREGSLELHRVAVGDHILLGGDNMDLALAHVVRQKLEADGKQLDRWQMGSLTHGCRIAKEKLLSDPTQDALPIVVPGRGSKLLGGSLRSELTRAEIDATLVDGFFPRVSAEERPKARARVGLTQLGLPYAADAAVTRHLAAFLGRQAGALAQLEGFVPSEGTNREGAKLLHPTAILFNGGVMKGTVLRNRLLETLNAWLEGDGAPPVRVLPSEDLDLAVARGASYYGLAKKGRGLRIRGGTARSYYVGIEDAAPSVPGVEPPITLLCVAPFGMEEGTEAQLPPHELGVVVGEPVRFRFFGSSSRREDPAGAALDYAFQKKDGEIEELSPIEVTLPAEGRREGDVVPVELRSRVTEVGTLLLEAIARDAGGRDPERWKLELSVRPQEGEEPAGA